MEDRDEPSRDAERASGELVERADLAPLATRGYLATSVRAS